MTSTLPKQYAWTALRLLSVGLFVSACDSNDVASGEPVRVAVAANFAAAHAALAKQFQQETHVRIETSVGSTGTLYAQIKNGAPFHIFLSADAERPRLLERERLSVAGSRRTYAIGRLVLYAPTWTAPPVGSRGLDTQSFEHLAIANPHIAPYGRAAEEVLRVWGLLETLQHKIVRGGNVNQVFQFVESGAADVGFIALSQVIERNITQYWIVPDSLYEPIVQDAVLLSRGETRREAQAFFDFLDSDEAQRLIASFGYALP